MYAEVLDNNDLISHDFSIGAQTFDVSLHKCVALDEAFDPMDSDGNAEMFDNKDVHPLDDSIQQDDNEQQEYGDDETRAIDADISVVTPHQFIDQDDDARLHNMQVFVIRELIDGLKMVGVKKYKISLRTSNHEVEFDELDISHSKDFYGVPMRLHEQLDHVLF